MKTNFLFCVMATSILLLCCNYVACKKHCKSEPNPSLEDLLNVQVDDSVKHLFGDSVSQIIFEPDSVKLLKLTVSNSEESLQSDSLISDSIRQPDFHGCFIAQDFGWLSKNEIRPLMFLLSDRSAYYTNNIRVKSPFMPDVALLFRKGGEQIDMVFSFTGGQMYIYMSNGNKIYEKYCYERLILIFFQQYLKDENIQKFLELNIY